MICEAVIATALRADGSTALRTLGSTPPIRLMPTPDGVYMVGAAASPLNGDRTSLDIFVAPGSELTVRTVAASLAWPGTSPVPSQFEIHAHVGAGATLSWLPEAMVPVAGSIHRVVASVELEPGASLTWREEIVLGRHNEAPGELSSSLEIEQGGQAVLRQENLVGEHSYDAPSVLGAARATGSLTIFRPEPIPTPAPASGEHGESAGLELESGGLQVVAVSDSATELRRLLDAAQPRRPEAASAEERTVHARA